MANTQSFQYVNSMSIMSPKSPVEEQKNNLEKRMKKMSVSLIET